MTRRVPWPVVLAGLLLALAAPAASAADVRISTDTSPQRALFGDIVHATVTVRAPSAAIVQGGFAPYEVQGSRSTSSSAGGVVTTTWTFDLQCLEPECSPGPGSRRIAVAPSRVLVGSRILTARFARLLVVPRATERQVAHPERAFLHPTAAPPAGYRFAPSTVRRLLLGAALVLVLAAALLVWPLVRRRADTPEVADADALARALALVRAARGRDAPDRRRALGLLARVLRRRGEPQVARAAADLAWSEPDPEADGMERLAERVEGSR
jgi:hypothetical protein